MIKIKHVRTALYILSSFIYLWAFYYLSATIILNLYFPKEILIRNATLRITSIWSVGIGRVDLRNVEIEVDDINYARIKLDYVTLRFNPFKLLTGEYTFNSLDIDGLNLYHARGMISGLDGRKPSVDLRMKPNRFGKEHLAYVFPDDHELEIAIVSIRNINELNSNYISLFDNIGFNFALLIKENIKIRNFGVSLDNTKGYSKNNKGRLASNIRGKLSREALSDFPIETLLFASDNIFRLQISADLEQSFFPQRKENRYDTLRIIGGESRINCDLFFQKNDIININNYNIESTAFEVFYDDFGLSGNTALYILETREGFSLNIEMDNISVYNGGKSISYPRGIVKIEIFNPMLALNSIGFISNQSHGSIYVKTNDNDPFTLYKTFNKNDSPPAGAEEMAKLLSETLIPSDID